MTRKRVNGSDGNENYMKKYKRESGHQDQSGELLCTSSNSREASFSMSSMEFRTGKILRMRLQNFMCHSNLVVDFSCRANFLVGGNGSGKSAVLTALVIGLGSRATATSRGSSISSFIKSGESSATIEIDLSNAGPCQYKEDIFGQKFTVIRHILASGPSTYKILSEWGKVIFKGPEALKELTSFLLTHNIQPQNPVFILNQDMARSFLKDSDPSKNFQLFLKASQLDVTRKNLDQCYALGRKFKHDVDSSMKTLKIYREDEANLEEKLFRLRSIDEMKDIRQKYLTEKSWLKVTAQEELIKKLVDEINEVKSKIEKLNEKLEDTSKIDGFQREIESLQSEQKTKVVEMSEKNNVLSQLKAERISHEEKLQIETTKIRKTNEKIKDIEKQIQDLNEGIEQISSISTSGISKQREKNEADIRDLEAKNDELNVFIQTAVRELSSFRDSRNQLMEQREDITRQMQNVIEMNSQLTAEIHRIQHAPKTNLLIYGEHMEKLLVSIDRAHAARRFSRKPIGPIGRFIEVPDRKWRTLVENIVRGMLRAFIVNSAQDRAVLDGILAKEFPGVKLDIITSKFQEKVYDVRRNAVMEVPGSHLLMNMIKCKNPVVMNRLIDSLSVETTLLVENQDLATKLTAEEENVPQNLTKVILLNPPLQFFPSPGYRIYPQDMRPPQYLQVNNEQRKQQLEIQCNENLQKVEQYKYELNEIKSKIMENNEHQKQKSTYLDNQRRTYDNNLSTINDLKNIEYPSKDELTVLANELDEMKEALATRLEDKRMSEKKLENWREKIKNIQISIKDQETLVKTVEGEMLQIKNKLDDIAVQQSSSRNNKIRFRNMKNQCEEEKQVMEAKLETESQLLSSLTTEAENIGQRVESTSTIDQIDKNIRRIEARIKSTASINENVEDVERKLMKKKQDLKNLEYKVTVIKKLLEELKESNMRQFTNVKSFKDYVTIRIEFEFQRLISIQNYEGHIEIKAENCTLTISVVPRDHHIDGAVSNTKQLSGGERSYITTAFLISLWSIVNHPFYFLDEYDVFTDQVNREIITKLLLREANASVQRQYVFLTPQDMSFLKASDTIKIHRFAQRRD